MASCQWDGSDDEDDAVLLFQSPVRSKSMMVMLSTVPPPPQEEEEPSLVATASRTATASVSAHSSSVVGVFRSPSNVVQYNPHSIYTGTYIQEVLQSFSSSPSSSEEVLEDDVPRALSPSDACTLQRIGSLHLSEDCLDSDAEEVTSSNALGGCYIFMDTEDEEEEGLEGDTDVYHDRTKDSFLTPATRPRNWNEQCDPRTEAALDREISIPRNEEAAADRHPVLSPMKQAIRTMLGGFKSSKKGKRYTTSLSPLDHPIEAANKHRISDLAVQAIADSCGPHSASITRNALVDFAFWEQAILNKQHSSFLDAGTAKTSSSSLADDDTNDVVDDDASGVYIKAVSLMVQDGKSTATSRSPSFLKTNPQQQQYDSILEEFDEMTRPSSEEVAQALHIEEEARVILSLVRGRTGMVEDLHDPRPSSSNDILIPWIHIVDDLWIPHYEEYVIRAVHAFSHQLLSFRTQKRPVLPM